MFRDHGSLRSSGCTSILQTLPRILPCQKGFPKFIRAIWRSRPMQGTCAVVPRPRVLAIILGIKGHYSMQSESTLVYVGSKLQETIWNAARQSRISAGLALQYLTYYNALPGGWFCNTMGGPLPCSGFVRMIDHALFQIRPVQVAYGCHTSHVQLSVQLPVGN